MTPTLSIPINAAPSQVINITLNNQSCTINVYQKRTGLYLDAYVNGAAVKTGILCHDRVALIRATYLGFPGELAFIDTQGVDDPTYKELGSRFILVWGAA